MPGVGTSRRGLAIEFGTYASSSALFQLSRLTTALLVARTVGPEEFGVWNGLQLIIMYGVLVTAGVPNGMNRQVPYLVGRSDVRTAAKVVDGATGYTAAALALIGLLLAGLGLWAPLDGEFRGPMIALGALFPAWHGLQFVLTLLRCRLRFGLASLAQTMFAVSLPLCAVPLSVSVGLSGFILGQAFAAVLVVVLIAVLIGIRPRFQLGSGDLRLLAGIGFPIMLGGLLFGFLTSVDRLVIATLLGPDALGLYTLAILSISALGLIPSVISQQMYPRMAHRYGETHSVEAVVPLAWKQSVAGIVAVVPVLLLAYVLLPIVVPRFMPEYVSGITPARIVLVGLATLPGAGGWGNLLNTTGRQMSYLWILACVTLLNAVVSVGLVLAGLGLNGAALGAAISYVAFTFSVIGFGIRVTRRDTRTGQSAMTETLTPSRDVES